VDYFVYPGYEHNVRGKDRVHLMQKVTDYFDERLQGGLRDSVGFIPRSEI
jgi:hypothetical protein